jgi:hypothetical protein
MLLTLRCCGVWCWWCQQAAADGAQQHHLQRGQPEVRLGLVKAQAALQPGVAGTKSQCHGAHMYSRQMAVTLLYLLPTVTLLMAHQSPLNASLNPLNSKRGGVGGLPGCPALSAQQQPMEIPPPVPVARPLS